MSTKCTENWLLVGVLALSFMGVFSRGLNAAPRPDLGAATKKVASPPAPDTAVLAPEACCFDPTGCVNVEPTDCTNAGGTAMGPGTTCAGLGPFCASAGACCLMGGGCDDTVSQFICEDGGGTFLGVGGACLANEGAGNSCSDGVDNDCDGFTDCDDPDCDGSAACTGACCAPDGTCADGDDETDCVNSGGQYQGDGTNCGSVSCPQPAGACCLTNLSCLSLTETDCANVPNSGWAGPLTTCADPFPAAEIPGATCCDGLDNDCDGLTDLDDPDCAGAFCSNPPAVAPAPHDRKKNRYISFTPNNGAAPVRFQVTKLTAPTPGVIGWVGNPDGNGIAKVEPAMPALRVWNEPVIHVGDCEIVPVAQYEIRASEGTGFSPPLLVSTIDLPSGGKPWGDTVGSFTGTEWTPPNGIVSVNDYLAALQKFQNLPSAPHLTVCDVQAVSTTDPCINRLVGIADVFLLVKASQGEAYPFITDPAACPPCP